MRIRVEVFIHSPLPNNFPPIRASVPFIMVV